MPSHILHDSTIPIALLIFLKASERFTSREFIRYENNLMQLIFDFHVFLFKTAEEIEQTHNSKLQIALLTPRTFSETDWTDLKRRA